MKLLLAYRDYFTDLPGGIERHVHQLAHGLASRADVDVLVGSKDGPTVVRDGPVAVHVRKELFRAQGIPVVPGLGRQMRSGGYDLIHIHSPNPTAEAALLMSRSKTARVATYHADIDRGATLFPLYRGFLRRVYGTVDRILVSSQELLNGSKFLSKLPEDLAARIRIVPLAVDLSRFRPRGSGPDKGRDDGLPVVLFVGRMRYYKGIDFLIEAMKKLPARLVLAGDGPFLAGAIQQGRAVLGDRFESLGRVTEDELPALYASADVFCLPSTSRAEAFGMAVLEAMASGLPVVTTDVGTATSAINVHGGTGLVVPPRSVPDLRDALSLLVNDQDLRHRLGARSRMRAEEYGIDRMVSSVFDMYEEAIKER